MDSKTEQFESEYNFFIDKLAELVIKHFQNVNRENKGASDLN